MEMNKTIRPLTPAWMDVWMMNLSPDSGEGGNSEDDTKSTTEGSGETKPEGSMPGDNPSAPSRPKDIK